MAKCGVGREESDGHGKSALLAVRVVVVMLVRGFLLATSCVLPAALSCPLVGLVLISMAAAADERSPPFSKYCCRMCALGAAGMNGKPRWT